MIKLINGLVLFFALSSLCASADIKLNTTSDEAFNSSIKSLMDELSPDKKKTFVTSVKSIMEMNKQLINKTPIEIQVQTEKQLNGKTADEIIEMAKLLKSQKSKKKTASTSLLHPMDFDGSQEHKDQAINFIKKRVEKDYCEGAIDMCQPSTLRMMEQQNLKAFKKSTQATNRQIMDKVISDYCNGAVDMCNYTTIQMMYEKNFKASQQELNW